MNRFNYSVILFSIFCVLQSANSIAQSTLNPDISVIPVFNLKTDDGSQLPQRRIFNRPEFSLEEFELALQAYLNPYARADIFLSKPGVGDEPIEIEEIYATFLRGLPYGLNVRIGKYKEEFGKLNPVHPHVWPFITPPLSIEKFLGGDGFSDLGISISKVIPTGDVVYTRLTCDILKGNGIGTINPVSKKVSGGIGLMNNEGEIFYANSGRLMTFFPVSSNSDLELGLSGITGIHDPINKLRFYYGNLDFKYKWKPTTYRSLTIQAEILLNRRKINKIEVIDDNFYPNMEKISTMGTYIYGDYQFHKIFSIGARYDWAQAPYSKDDKAQGIAIFLGYYPVEETSAFRLQYQITKFSPYNTSAYSVNMIALQFMFSMGPHKAHPF